MHASMPLIVTMAAALGLALVLGMAAARLRLPALVGYLLAGVVIGPHTPGFVADLGLAAQLAEIGVILLMFGVGPALLDRRSDGGAQDRHARAPWCRSLAATLHGHAGLALGPGAGLWAAALVFGLALSVASTVVLLRALESSGGWSRRHRGRIAVGWLVVEDLVMVLVLVLLPALAGLLGGHAAGGAERHRGAMAARCGASLGLTLAVLAFVALMLMGGKR